MRCVAPHAHSLAPKRKYEKRKENKTIETGIETPMWKALAANKKIKSRLAHSGFQAELKISLPCAVRCMCLDRISGTGIGAV
jgi:hypothetical protein